MGSNRVKVCPFFIRKVGNGEERTHEMLNLLHVYHHTRWRTKMASEMHRALEKDEFRVYYQPLVSLQTGRVSGVEALVRWEHPRRGLLPPGEFVQLAEETGLIVPLGQWVLEEACRHVSLWRERSLGDPPLVLNVNVSAGQFRHVGLAEDIAQALRESALDPHALKLEITESMAIADMQSTVNTLHDLKDLGIRLAIDDFGTGHSALAYLKCLPVDTLKIDRSFVGGLGASLKDTAIVRAVIALAKALGLSITGEGIETIKQLTYLRALGCDLGQGYYFAEPLPAKQNRTGPQLYSHLRTDTCFDVRSTAAVDRGRPAGGRTGTGNDHRSGDRECSRDRRAGGCSGSGSGRSC